MGVLVESHKDPQARLASLSRWHPEDREEIERARSEHRQTQYLRDIKEVVASAPPLTPEARDIIRDLLRPVIREAGQDD